jgi:hypothetical protein
MNSANRGISSQMGDFRFGRGARGTLCAAVVAAACLGLGGCSGGSGNLLGSLTGGGDAAAAVAAVPAASLKAKLAFMPVVGAPADISAKLNGSVVSAVERASVPVSRSPGDPADYTVRGYVVAAPGTGSTKVTYIWDVSDKAGQRAHRIKGEELVKAKAGQDPWAAFDDVVISRIAEQTSAQLAAWVPAKPVGGAPAGAAAAVAPMAAAPAISGTQAQPVSLSPAPAGGGVNGQVVQPAGSMAALPAGGPLGAIVPPVVGAPGDGQALLTQAIQKYLTNSGVNMAAGTGVAASTVQGKVTMGQPSSGKQSVTIEWIVTDPAGKRVGTVKQSNIVPQGSLDGTWGRTADLAAREAAKGVADLLRSVNQRRTTAAVSN